MVPFHYSSLFAFPVTYNASLGESTLFHAISTYLELELFSLFLDSSLPDFSLTRSAFPRHAKSLYETKILNNFPLFPPRQTCKSHDTLNYPFLIVQSVCVCWSHYVTVFSQFIFVSYEGPLGVLCETGYRTMNT